VIGVRFLDKGCSSKSSARFMLENDERKEPMIQIGSEISEFIKSFFDSRQLTNQALHNIQGPFS